MPLKSVSRKLLVTACALVVLLVSGYLYIRYHFLQAKNFKPDRSKAKNILDLRPEIIAKLQQVVRDGSNGLYVLSIEKLNIDILASALDAENATINIDTIAMRQLDKLGELPDDIFKIKFATLHISGLVINDLINRKTITINEIDCTQPIITVFHQPRVYNEKLRKAEDTLSFYKKIQGSINSIVIAKINIGRGTFLNYDLQVKSKVTKFNVVSIIMKDLLVDSTTQYDNNRFLFTKYTAIECNNYFFRTPDSLYLLKVGSLYVSGEKHTVIASDVELEPRGNKQQFESKLSSRKVMLHLTFPKITLTNINWWSLINHERFIANEAYVTNGNISIYLDRSLKAGALQLNNFPHQVLLGMGIPVSVKKLSLQALNIAFEEFNPDSKSSGTISFDDIHGTAHNISNLNSDIRKAKFLSLDAKGLFMRKVPMAGKFTFDLSKGRTGDFIADFFMDTLNNTTINAAAETLGLFTIRTGQMQGGSAHLEGNNSTVNGNLTLRYTNLHIDPLKDINGEPGKLKKKTVTSIFANIFLIKNSNPSKNNVLRQPTFSVARGNHSNFFSFFWAAILTGILKTIGIPVKLVLK
jgi:hypothetical protein